MTGIYPQVGTYCLEGVKLGQHWSSPKLLDAKLFCRIFLAKKLLCKLGHYLKRVGLAVKPNFVPKYGKMFFFGLGGNGGESVFDIPELQHHQSKGRHHN